jgi:hypothetical protein
MCMVIFKSLTTVALFLKIFVEKILRFSKDKCRVVTESKFNIGHGDDA